jgi:hypothetical protein
MYNVGFGDCFLVSFEYASGPARHVLIDCGTSTEDDGHMHDVAKQVATDCEGRLTAIVATHRHRDHVSGFGDKSIQQVLERLNPDLVVQPWTEHPKAGSSDTKAPSVFTAAGLKLSADGLRYLHALRMSERFCMHLAANTDRLLPGLGERSRKQLAFVAGLQVSNAGAVQWLQKSGKRLAFVYAGSPSGLDEMLPGIKVQTLGPPTLGQSAAIRKQSTSNSEQFWKLQALLSRAMPCSQLGSPGKPVLLRGARTESIAAAPPYARWWIHHVDRAQGQNMQAIVTALDDAMNNTSVILLFEVGGKWLLFPGDAQWESWQYALSIAANCKQLALTNLYKVGHHGSTNATPRKGLWDSFVHRGKGSDRLVTLLSTKPGKHNNVPRESLLEALEAQSSLTSTEGMKTLSSSVSF